MKPFWRQTEPPKDIETAPATIYAIDPKDDMTAKELFVLLASMNAVPRTIRVLDADMMGAIEALGPAFRHLTELEPQQ